MANKTVHANDSSIFSSNKILFKLTRLSLAVVTASVGTAPLQALTVEEVVVTAQKREQSANDVSVAISAFNGDDLAEIGVVDTRDLSNLIPGFSFADSGQNAPIYSLRGIGFNEKSQTASSTVGVYIDEVALPFPVMTKGANLDLERVEVLKGPQGTLYGRNTTGGAINYIARKPTETFEAGVVASYGRFETTDLEGFVSGPLSESAGYRLAFRNIHSGEGWQKSLSRTPGTAYQERDSSEQITDNPVGVFDTLGEKDKQSARLKTVFYPSETLTINASVDYWRDQSDAQAAQPFLLQSQSPLLRWDSLNPNTLNQPLTQTPDNRWADWPVGELGTNSGTLFNNWQVNDTFLMGTFRVDKDISETHTLTFLTAYADFESDDSRLPSSGLAGTNQDIIQFVNTELYSIELRLSGDNGEDMNWLGGLFYSYDHVTEEDHSILETAAAFFNVGENFDVLQVIIDQARAQGLPESDIQLVENIVAPILNTINLPTPLVGDVVGTKGDQETDIKAIFGNLEWQIDDAFKLTTGLRYTEETRDFEGCTHDTHYSTAGIGTNNLFNVLPAIYGGPILLFSPDALQRGDCIVMDRDNGFRPSLITRTLSEDNISGRIALDWTPNDEMLFYASFARGFKSGSFPILSSSFSDQYDPATQEQLNALELGWKTSLVDGLMQFNGAIFYYDYKDKQLLGSVRDPIFGQLPKLQNAPESNVQGVEMDMQFSPIDGLYLSVAASYIETEIEEYWGYNELGVLNQDTINDPVLQGRESFAGQPFNFSPELEFTLLVNYVLPIGNLYELTIGADYSYTDETSAILSGYIDNAPVDPLTETGEGRAIGYDASGNVVAVDSEDFHIEDYAIVNARMSFGTNDDVWKVTLWGRNITNEVYVNSIINPGDGISRYTGMPATYGISFSYNYF